jgi:hypothetical protein
MSIKITKEEAVRLCGEVIDSIEEAKGIEFIFRSGNDLIVATTQDSFRNDLGLETIRGIGSGRSGFIVPILENRDNEKMYLNRFVCPNDNTEWEDVSDCMCNDRCPTCNKEIEPVFSEEVLEEEE